VVDYPNASFILPFTNGTFGTRTSPTDGPLLTVPAHGRAVYQTLACITTCLEFLTGPSDSPGWVGSNVDAKSYLNERFYPDVAKDDFYGTLRGPVATGVSLTGTVQLSMGNLTNLVLDLKQPFLPLTTYVSQS